MFCKWCDALVRKVHIRFTAKCMMEGIKLQDILHATLCVKLYNNVRSTAERFPLFMLKEDRERQQ